MRNKAVELLEQIRTQHLATDAEIVDYIIYNYLSSSDAFQVLLEFVEYELDRDVDEFI